MKCHSPIFLLLSGVSLLTVPALTVTVADAAHASTSRTASFDIPSTDLASALNEAGRQADIRIAFPYDVAATIRTPALKGQMTALDAVRRLISGSALRISTNDASHILLVADTTTIAASLPQSSEAGETGEAIMVTGYRLSNRRALGSKRDSAQIIDAISQDEASQLPDVNIVEASRRIPGISVMADRDASRSHDNYQYVTIRGLDSRYNLVTVDGTQIASADSNFRGAQLAMLPSSLVSEIQAVKTVSAQYDPHALGGQINLVTKSAFDTGNYFSGKALIGQTSQKGKVVPDDSVNIRADATAAALFGAEKQFGIVISGEYQRLGNSALASLPGDSGGAGWAYYTAAGQQTSSIAASTGEAVPVRVQDYAFKVRRERYSVNGKLEYRPDDRFGISVFGGYYHEQSSEDRYEALALPAAATYTPGATSGTGTLRTGNYQLGLVDQPEKRRTWLVNAKAYYDFTDDLKLSLGLSNSNARYQEERWMYKWNTGMNQTTGSTTNLPDFGYGYTVVNGEPVLTMNNPEAAANASNYGPRYWRNIRSTIDNKVRVARGDLAWNFDPDDRGFGLNIGFNQTLTHVKNRLKYREWFAKDPASAALIGNLDHYSQSTVLTPLLAPGINFYLIDKAKAQSVLQDHPEWFRETNRTSNDNAAFYDLRESITAFYGQAIWRSDDFSLLAGIRHDDSDVRVDNLNRVTAGGSNSYVPYRRTAGYSYLLPSAIATWDVTPTMKLRASISETLGRPDYGQYGATTTTSFDGASLYISQGNPDLKPRRAWNYDLSYEYYMGSGSVLSAALFYKDIKNEIFTQSSIGSGIYDGETYQAVISQPVNAANAAIKGAELQIVKDKLDFLPGPLANLGVSLNATWLDGHFDFVNGDGVTRRIDALYNQPNHIYNASLYYSDDRLNLRFAWNRIGSSPLSVDSSVSWRDIWASERDQIDLQGSYYITPSIQITAQVQNLTKESFTAYLGENRELLQTRYPVGRTFWLGVSFTPGLKK